MSWTILLAIGVYLAAEGVKGAMEENRNASLPRPPRHPQIPNNAYDELPYDCEVWPEDDYDDL